MMSEHELGKKPVEGGIRTLAFLSGLGGLVGCVSLAIMAAQTDYASAGVGSPRVAYGSHVNYALALYAIGTLVSGFVSAYLLMKFAAALEILRELQARR